MNQPSGVIAIVSETCSLYYRKIWDVVFLAALLFLFEFLLKIVPAQGNYFIFHIFFVISYLFLNFLLSIVYLIIALNEDISVIDALSLSLKKIIPYSCTGIFYFLIVISGSFLIIPGIYFMISLSFFGCIVITENRSKIDALIASRLYVQDYWWNICVKFLVLNLFLILFLIPIGLLGYFIISVSDTGYLTEIINKIITNFITPFYLFSIAVIYKDLKEVKGEVDTKSSNQYFWWFMALGVPLLILLAFIFLSRS